MRVFFAISPSSIYFKMLEAEKVANCLVSYAFIKNPQKLIDLWGDYRPKNLILDSGAFSVWSKGDVVDIDKYAEFCTGVKEVLPAGVNLYVVNLDVLPGKFGERPTDEQRESSARQGWENMLYLESKGLKVIHVFHQHESFEWLEKMRNHSDYIGISPANDCSMKEKMHWLNEVFGIIKDTIKTHGFAVTSHHQLYKYPFYSVDSSSWTAPARFGRIPVFTDTLEMISIEYKDKEKVKQYWDYLKQIGIDELASDDYSIRVKLAIRSFQKLEQMATNIWTKRGVKFMDSLTDVPITIIPGVDKSVVL